MSGGVGYARPFRTRSEYAPKLGNGSGVLRPDLTPSKTSGVSRMEYKGFYVQAFEREPGKWRANIRRVDGKLVKVVSREKLEKSATKLDATTAVAAMVMAMDVIDAETFVRVATEKFWPRRGKSSESRACGSLSRRTRATSIAAGPERNLSPQP